MTGGRKTRVVNNRSRCVLNFILVESFFICWITFHFQVFQSAAIGEKNKNWNEDEMWHNSQQIVEMNILFFF